jgi:PAS domain S-box-containing protein
LERAGQEVYARQKAERVEREQRKRFETTLGSIGDAVISTDAEGKVTFFNQVAQSLLRRPGTEMLGKHLDDVFQIVSEQTREKLESPVARVLRDGAIVELGAGTILIARDGAEIPIDDSVAPIRGENGEIQGMVLVFRDITTRKRAEVEGRLLASIVESSDDAIISKDLSGVITSWNTGAERILEYTAQEAVGRPISMIAAPDRLDEMPGILERIKRGERIDHFETVRRAPRRGGTSSRPCRRWRQPPLV